MTRAGVALAILLLAAWTRASHRDWDAGALLHPDERFLAMVAADARIPASAGDYLDPARTSLGPANLGHAFFVYGTLPLALGRLAADLSGDATPAAIARMGRALAAAADVATTALVMAIGALLAGARAAGWAGLAYALAVLAIQQAHFYTVDAFLTCFGSVALAGCVAFQRTRRAAWLVAGAAGFGAALACKLSAGLAAPLLAALVAAPDARATPRSRALAAAAFAALAYAALRLADPPLFASAAWLDPRPSPRLVESLAQLRALSRPDSYYPPAIQWLDRAPVAFALSNLARFGLGAAWLALALGGAWLALRAGGALRWIALWALGAFLFHALQTVQPLRYFLPIVPALAVLAGMAAAALAGAPRRPRCRPPSPSRWRSGRPPSSRSTRARTRASRPRTGSTSTRRPAR
jgi:4-amino-4-deoxy-L-arabinose transferase-like glycosyltransferase